MVSLFANAAGRFGIKPKEAERFFKFLVVGSVGFVVDFGVYNLLLNPLKALFAVGTAVHEALVSLGISPAYVDDGLAALLAGTISFIAAIISNFIWNRYWTYPDSRSKAIWGQFVQFTLVSLTGIVLRLPIIGFSRLPFTRLAENVAPTLAPDLIERIGENLALALSVLIILFWNFFVNRYWTYNDVD
jgi:putative flippase GtrA